MPRHADPTLPGRRREQILDAALACFRERGFRQTTLEEICAEARISPGAFYRVFSCKTDLIAAVALGARADAAAQLTRIEGAESLIDELAQMAGAFLRSLEGGDRALLADIWAEAARDAPLAAALAAQDEHALALVTAAIGRAQRRGEIYTALSPDELAQTLLAALEGMALRQCLRPAKDCNAEVRRFRSLALHLLKPKR